MFLGYGRVALAVTIAVAVVGLGTSELDPAIATTRVAGLPADPAEISRLPVFSPAISQQVIGRIMTLIAAMQALLGGVAVVTQLAAASMSIQERLRELSVLHAVGTSTPTTSRFDCSGRASPSLSKTTS